MIVVLVTLVSGIVVVTVTPEAALPLGSVATPPNRALPPCENAKLPLRIRHRNVDVTACLLTMVFTPLM